MSALGFILLQHACFQKRVFQIIYWYYVHMANKQFEDIENENEGLIFGNLPLFGKKLTRIILWCWKEILMFAAIYVRLFCFVKYIVICWVVKRVGLWNRSIRIYIEWSMVAILWIYFNVHIFGWLEKNY